MATIWAQSDGTVIHLDLPERSALLVNPPADAANLQRLDFDGDTNGALVDMLVRELDQWSTKYRLASGALTRAGVAVPIAADGPAARDAKLMAQIRALLDSDTAPTAAQLRVILRYILRKIS